MHRVPRDSVAGGRHPPSAYSLLFPSEETVGYFVWLLDPCGEIIAFLAAERVVLLCTRPDFARFLWHEAQLGKVSECVLIQELMFTSIEKAFKTKPRVAAQRSQHQYCAMQQPSTSFLYNFVQICPFLSNPTSEQLILQVMTSSEWRTQMHPKQRATMPSSFAASQTGSKEEQRTCQIPVEVILPISKPAKGHIGHVILPLLAATTVVAPGLGDHNTMPLSEQRSLTQYFPPTHSHHAKRNLELLCYGRKTKGISQSHFSSSYFSTSSELWIFEMNPET